MPPMHDCARSTRQKVLCPSGIWIINSQRGSQVVRNAHLGGAALTAESSCGRHSGSAAMASLLHCSNLNQRLARRKEGPDTARGTTPSNHRRICFQAALRILIRSWLPL